MANGTYIHLPLADARDSGKNPPVSTITFFRGQAPPGDLRCRLQAVLDANPWLAGEYRRHPETGTFPTLWVPDNPDCENHFTFIEKTEIAEGQPYTALQKQIKPFLVNRGRVGRAKAPNPLFKVIVNRNSPESFSLIVSMCHTLGDGHTYYRILNSLAQNAEIKPMDAHRQACRQAVENFVGKERIAWFRSPGNLLPLLLKMLFKKHCTAYRYINMDWVAKQKASFTPTDEIPFISTNDVLSALFMDALQLDACLVAVNPRGRIPELHDAHAGDYEAPHVFMKGEWRTPAHIRRTLMGDKPSTWGSVPGLQKSMMMNTGFISNWAGWNASLELAGAAQHLHIPLFAKPLFPNMVVIWKPQADRLAVLLNVKAHTLSAIDSHPALQEPVIDD